MGVLVNTIIAYCIWMDMLDRMIWINYTCKQYVDSVISGAAYEQ